VGKTEKKRKEILKGEKKTTNPERGKNARNQGLKRNSRGLSNTERKERNETLLMETKSEKSLITIPNSARGEKTKSLAQGR